VVTLSQKYAANYAASPSDLNTDLSDDENGKGVHEECYVRRISASHPPAAVVAN
jgi:hypothetical protein